MDSHGEPCFLYIDDEYAYIYIYIYIYIYRERERESAVHVRGGSGGKMAVCTGYTALRYM